MSTKHTLRHVYGGRPAISVLTSSSVHSSREVFLTRVTKSDSFTSRGKVEGRNTPPQTAPAFYFLLKLHGSVHCPDSRRANRSKVVVSSHIALRCTSGRLHQIKIRSTFTVMK